ncbi:MAG: hypothetical protein CMM75_11510 [Rhodospirillaceae bacterium]|jgi:hypothetical protein|nr:hypothetical protein [Rhodospirillaceae bacterium]
MIVTNPAGEGSAGRNTPFAVAQAFAMRWRARVIVLASRICSLADQLLVGCELFSFSQMSVLAFFKDGALIEKNTYPPNR